MVIEKGGQAGAQRHPRCRPFVLPPYSPDLNPIEMMFAKLKASLRKSDERSVDATWRRVGEVLKAVSGTNAPPIQACRICFNITLTDSSGVVWRGSAAQQAITIPARLGV
ncbi:transposase [Sinorhizobium meliloti CCNWSX0020]|uniref:Transposase n=1 Tax=Sinorhizobium meliloti CCNWSX0020 TaxID=1107881 RepID=H0G845_RHIML|nr:transposase [Sinorhizobium meliloti CCNWSX0020]